MKKGSVFRDGKTPFKNDFALNKIVLENPTKQSEIDMEM